MHILKIDKLMRKNENKPLWKQNTLKMPIVWFFIQ